MFVDNATITVKAGKGGDGLVSFRREKFVEKGGPDGGDGGKGGDVIVVGDRNMDGLANYRHSRLVEAEVGENGGRSRRHGSNGEHAIFKVPLGTEIWEGDDLLADITENGVEVTIARGGSGGFGNAHFVSSRRQAPRVAELGEKGEQKELRLELKLIADIGLVGMPNAGKSTFLSVVSNAQPKIANYPFTTLAPNLGVADIDSHSLLIADIPGLIEGASKGKGLGVQFLRHIERTAVILHFIDSTDQNIPDAYDTIMSELKAYEIDLSGRPQLIALTKVDAVDEKAAKKLQKALKEHSGREVFLISSQAHKGITELLRTLHTVVARERAKEDESEQEDDTAGVPVMTLQPSADEWTVEQSSGNSFVIKGVKIERFAERTDFSNQEGVRRLKDIMRKMGIIHELERRGLEPGDRIAIGPHRFNY